MDNSFPRIPINTDNVRLLHYIEMLSVHILDDKNADEHARKCGAYLYILGTAPHKADFVYFVLYQDLIPFHTELNEFYNTYIYNQRGDYAEQTLENQIGSFRPYFMAFQEAFEIVNRERRHDPDWSPMIALLWTFYSSLFSASRRERLLAHAIHSMDTAAKRREEHN
jgi:hypothetical protein